jgi:hypothetical protein
MPRHSSITSKNSETRVKVLGHHTSAAFVVSHDKRGLLSMFETLSRVFKVAWRLFWFVILFVLHSQTVYWLIRRTSRGGEVPFTFEDFSVTRLSRCLGEKVTSFLLEPVCGGNMSDCARVMIQYERSTVKLPTTFFWKSLRCKTTEVLFLASVVAPVAER